MQSAVNRKEAVGSPPRVRGKLPPSVIARPAVRITPARAGKTPTRSKHTRMSADHPRACGENEHISRYPAFCGGSPPRVRGKRTEIFDPLDRFRITPARAGKTCDGHAAFTGYRDHPRACGENVLREEEVLLNRGSPPRVRGKQGLEVVCARIRRITPARAGKTFLPS